MLRLALALSVILATPVLAQDIPAPRPMDQMRGDCAAFALDVTREAALWAAGPRTALTASAAASGAPALATGTLARLALLPQTEMQFAVTPEQDRGGAGRHAGHLRLEVPQAGLWRVAASNGLWFDAVAGGAILPSSAFEMQTGCGAPFKVVVFELPAGAVTLQFNGSPSPQVEVVALPWTE